MSETAKKIERSEAKIRNHLRETSEIIYHLFRHQEIYMVHTPVTALFGMQFHA